MVLSSGGPESRGAEQLAVGICESPGALAFALFHCEEVQNGYL